MPQIFISYAHEDKRWRDYVDGYVGDLSGQDGINVWSDQNIEAGDDWEKNILRALDVSDGVIFLVSAAFLRSRYIASVEVPIAVAKRAADGAHVWPLIISSCSWKRHKWLRRVQARPLEADALDLLPRPRRNKAMTAFAAEIYSKLVPAVGPSERVIVELYLPNNLADLDPKERAVKLRQIEEILATDGEIKIKRMKKGSTRLFVEMSAAQAEKITKMINAGVLPAEVFEFRRLLSDDERRGLELFIFRGEPVIRDEAVAALFGVATKVLNQAVKRNMDRFDDEHRFQLNDVEWDELRSQIVTTKTGRGGRRTPPYMFTEAGVMMASTVLRSDRAVEAAKLLVRVFVAARHEARDRRHNRFPVDDEAAITEGLKVFDGAREDDTGTG